MPVAHLLLPREEIADFCRRNRIRRLALFGSVLRGDSGPDSDVDLLVEFESGHRLGLTFFALQDELSELLGRKVDLNTREDLSRHFRDEVARTAEPIYEAESVDINLDTVWDILSLDLPKLERELEYLIPRLS
jgi:uncharacterized protein